MSKWMIGKMLRNKKKKEEFYSNLNMKDITDADYMHARFVKTLKDKFVKTLK